MEKHHPNAHCIIAPSSSSPSPPPPHHPPSAFLSPFPSPSLPTNTPLSHTYLYKPPSPHPPYTTTRSALGNNESTEVQTLRAICLQLYHQCFEQVWQHNFTSIIGLRRSTQRHRSSKVGTSIVDLRKSTHRSLKIEGRNIAPTTQHRTDIPTIRHRILSTA